MKKRNLLSFIGLFILIVPALCASKFESKKGINKTFDVNANCSLVIDSKYGKIEIIEWDKNKISFSIEIIGKASSQNTAKALADQYTVKFSQTPQMVSANTESTGQNPSPKGNSSISITYTVHVPRSVIMQISNKYGNVVLNNTSQPFSAQIKYGDLRANGLLGNNNKIDLKYGNLNVSEVNGLNLDCKYSNVNIDKTSWLKCVSGYSNLSLVKSDKLDIESKYDNYKIDQVATLNGDAKYTTFKINKLSKSFAINDIKYGNIKINDVAPTLSLISINGAYTDIKIGLDTKLSAQCNISVDYAKVIVKNLNQKSLSIQKSGYTGEKANGVIGDNRNTTAKIEIANRYSNVVLYAAD